jgi:hypothetical protein
MLQQTFEILKRLMQNPFEFAACIMNVNCKWLRKVLVLAAGCVFLFLFSTGWLRFTVYIMKVARHAPMHIQDAGRRTCHLLSTSCKAARRSPMRVHDVAGESTIYYQHHQGV